MGHILTIWLLFRGDVSQRLPACLIGYNSQLHSDVFKKIRAKCKLYIVYNFACFFLSETENVVCFQ